MDKLFKEKYNSVCCCPRCINDVAAIALNYLPPHYYGDRVEKKEETGSPWMMVEAAVVEAIDRVMENPNHDDHAQHTHTRSDGASRIVS